MSDEALLTALRRVRDLLRRQQAEIDWLKDQFRNDPNAPRGVMCIYCGENVLYDPAEGIQAAIDKATAHDAECPQNPLVQRIATLTAERDSVRDALRVSRGQWIHSVNAEQCLKALNEPTPWDAEVLEENRKQLARSSQSSDEPIYTIIAPKDSLEIRYEVPQPAPTSEPSDGEKLLAAIADTPGPPADGQVVFKEPKTKEGQVHHD